MVLTSDPSILSAALPASCVTPTYFILQLRSIHTPERSNSKGVHGLATCYEPTTQVAEEGQHYLNRVSYHITHHRPGFGIAIPDEGPRKIR